jgi:hypothetical protein
MSLTKSSSRDVLHRSRLMRLTATRSFVFFTVAACTRAVAPRPEYIKIFHNEIKLVIFILPITSSSS